MSRVAKNPVDLPSSVEVKMNGRHIQVKGPKGELSLNLHSTVDMVHEGNQIRLAASTDDSAMAMAGTMRALVSNMVTGVSVGYEKKLTIVGVGYRAQAQGNSLNLSLGFSHPVVYQIAKGVSVETPSQTEIVVSGTDKQLVGQTAAEIRRFRPPEPYKGKGVRYADEQVRRKQAKKA
ncbi:MAG TPA: 50S ribosomal protein L6 [Gammaproteobacteria bacterium]|nr:50S ribosomal protein L6 [Acidiferrobacteraceae bacterium]HAU10124.1 50S ribosomal protein L6 [Gammaproteobacteria bacterium]|tara:strand:- start:4561 stop:5091 length:531 start_codon:yes stop_codon:yes gene_type:complete